MVARPRGKSMGSVETSATLHSPGQCAGISAQTGVRRPGGQPHNQNRQVHGGRSARAVLKRKTGAASRKAAGLILARLDLLPAYRCRPRPLRPDQLRHLDPEGLALLRRLGVLGAD